VINILTFLAVLILTSPPLERFFTLPLQATGRSYSFFPRLGEESTILLVELLRPLVPYESRFFFSPFSSDQSTQCGISISRAPYPLAGPPSLKSNNRNSLFSVVFSRFRETLSLFATFLSAPILPPSWTLTLQWCWSLYQSVDCSFPFRALGGQLFLPLSPRISFKMPSSAV